MTTIPPTIRVIAPDGRLTPARKRRLISISACGAPVREPAADRNSCTNEQPYTSGLICAPFSRTSPGLSLAMWRPAPTCRSTLHKTWISSFTAPMAI